MERLFDDNNFKLKFDGQLHQIDANTLVSSLIHTTSIIQEINRYLDTGKKVEIKVKALEKGSFLVHIELLESAYDTVKSLFTKDNVEFSAALISIFVGVIEIKRFLKGKKAKSAETKESKTEIINEKGDILVIENVTFNIYENSPVVKDAISQNFDSIDNDPSVSGYEILNREEKPIIRINKEEFADLSLKSDIIQNDERIIIEAATLNIMRLSFEPGLKWDFYFKGNKISAKISDPNFHELINKGERFAKGDTLEVELQITQKWEESVNTFINKSYQVNSIKRHILRNEQLKINFEG